MNEGRTHHFLPVLTLALAIVTLIGVATNTVTMLKLTAELKRAPPRALPCSAIPTRLVLEDPICAQKLLDSMNVTNVRIHARRNATYDAVGAASARSLVDSTNPTPR